MKDTYVLYRIHTPRLIPVFLPLLLPLHPVCRHSRPKEEPETSARSICSIDISVVMPRPRPPSRIEPLSFPVFCISWFGDPSNGRSITAYAGGGGSAKTGVFNNVVIQDGDQEELKISTGDKVGVALHIYKNPVTHKLWMIVALGGEVHRYSMPKGTLDGVLTVVDNTSNEDAGAPKDYCSAIAINAMTDQMAVGCESGIIKVYAASDDTFADADHLYICEGHTKSICALSFSMRGGKLLSSAKDGFARVWDSSTGKELSKMFCECGDQGAPPPQRAQQILVRGCAFADMDGKVALTVASARRGKAFLSQWFEKEAGKTYECAVRSECSPCPVSAMSMSQDGTLLAFGNVEGSIILWSVLNWAAIKIFPLVHELPVTCIAARPFDVELQGEEFTGVRINARSASADSQLGCLTLQRKAPKRKDESRGSGGKSGLSLLLIHRLLWTVVFSWILSPVARQAVEKCEHAWKEQGLHSFRRCLMDDVLIAPSTRPGVMTPPY